ncbi:MAG TPA: 5'-3' exonuclease, partial [Noviherbaspirillum sp.]|nr:5'-3' exonuclease [Noviherbaspirillum sp.]
LNSYGTLEGVMGGAGILLTTTGSRLRAGRAMAFLSRELVRLKTNVTLGVAGWRALRYPRDNP